MREYIFVKKYHQGGIFIDLLWCDIAFFIALLQLCCLLHFIVSIIAVICFIYFKIWLCFLNHFYLSLLLCFALNFMNFVFIFIFLFIVKGDKYVNK